MNNKFNNISQYRNQVWIGTNKNVYIYEIITHSLFGNYLKYFLYL